jgi:hypothetical protein
MSDAEFLRSPQAFVNASFLGHPAQVVRDVAAVKLNTIIFKHYV